MNFAWIGTVFGFVGSKKDVFSVKRISKAINIHDLLKNKQSIPAFQYKKFDVIDFAQAMLFPVKKLVPLIYTYTATDLRSGHYLLAGMKKEILFPYHGFW